MRGAYCVLKRLVQAWMPLACAFMLFACSGATYGAAGEPSAAQTQREYAYVLSFSGNAVTGYQIDNAGNLSPLQKDALPITGEASDIATVPNGSSVFIVNKTRNQIDQFHIGPDGLLDLLHKG